MLRARQRVSRPVTRASLRRISRSATSLLAAAATVTSLGALSGACAPDEPSFPKEQTLGRELFALVCDRVGAQALREDLTGASFRNVCHPKPDGSYENEVKTEMLPALQRTARNTKGEAVSLDQQKANRAHRVARIEALARHRDELIEAFEAMIPAIDVPVAERTRNDSGVCIDGKSSKTRPLRRELAASAARMLDLFGDGTVVDLTRSLGDFVSAVKADTKGHEAVTHILNRTGYQPADLALGFIRPAVAYPRLPDLSHALLSRLANGPELDALSEVAHHELRDLAATPPDPVPAALVERPDPLVPGRAILSRPRTALELVKGMAFSEDDVFKVGDSRLVVRRDVRGVALVSRIEGKLPSPFLDATGDGLPDVDERGVFVTTSGVAPTPFFAPAAPESAGARDALGRATSKDNGTPLYAYLDTSRTLLASVLRDARRAFPEAPDGTPRAAPVDLLAAAPALGGARAAKPTTQRTYADGGRVTYRGFDAKTAPLVDLVYALGQLLAMPSMRDGMALVRSLAAEHPSELARLVRVVHEMIAAMDEYPNARLSPRETFGDDLLALFIEIGREPGLLEDFFRNGLGDPNFVPLGEMLVKYVTHRDELAYMRDSSAPADEALLNGPPMLRGTSKPIDPKNPFTVEVDRGKPDTGTNRSLLQRMLAALHETIGVPICTKPGAVAHMKIRWPPDAPVGVPVDFDYPTSRLLRAVCAFVAADIPDVPLPACSLIKVDNIADTIVSFATGKVKFETPDKCLAGIIANKALTVFSGPLDTYMAQMSGIKGFDIAKPELGALGRFGYFEAPYAAFPESPAFLGDNFYPKTRDFVKDVIDPVPTALCPQVQVPGPYGTTVTMRQCRSFADTLRARHDGVLFSLDVLPLLDGLAPLAKVFDQHGKAPLVIKLLDTLHLHYGTEAQSKDECDPSLPKTDPRWCPQDGGARLEPVVARVARGDTFPALHDIALALRDTKISHCDSYDASGACTATRDVDGISVFADLVRSIIDPANWKNAADRRGRTYAERGDGERTELSGAYLLFDALGAASNALDRFAKEPGGEGLAEAWRKATMSLLDTFAAVEGDGKETRFRNPATPRALTMLVDAFGSELVARCPQPGQCPWLQRDLADSVGSFIEGPLFAALVDVVDAVRTDGTARAELDRFIAYFLAQSEDLDVLRATTSATADFLELLEDRENLKPLMGLLAHAFAPGNKGRRAVVPEALAALGRLNVRDVDASGKPSCISKLDPNQAMQVVLERLVTPSVGGRTPLEVIGAAIMDVNRADPNTTGPLLQTDVQNAATEVEDFVNDPSSGLARVVNVLAKVTAAK